jgi:hypothetical protein
MTETIAMGSPKRETAQASAEDAKVDEVRMKH